LDPRGELPSPPFSSLSLFLSLPFFSPARAPPTALACGPLRPRRGGLRPRRRGPAPAPSPARGPLCAAPAPGGAARPGPLHAVSAPGTARVASAWPRAPPFTPTRSRVRSPTRAVIYSWFLINFKLRLVSVLRHALRRATNLFNFRFY
jgi:hypothetical protein